MILNDLMKIYIEIEKLEEKFGGGKPRKPGSFYSQKYEELINNMFNYSLSAIELVNELKLDLNKFEVIKLVITSQLNGMATKNKRIQGRRKLTKLERLIGKTLEHANFVSAQKDLDEEKSPEAKFVNKVIKHSKLSESGSFEQIGLLNEYMK